MVQTKNPIIIGTRNSPLALIQANEVREKLLQIHKDKELNIIIKPIITGGDRTQKYNLSMSESADFTNNHEGENKFGIFSKEIELELLKGNIDLAVHSAKDMVSILPNGLVMDVFLARQNVRDCFISLKYKSLDELPKGAIIGTSSIRRRAQILRVRPDVKFVEFRGNIDTRLKKLRQNIASATILAAAGLKRLGKEEKITQYLDIKQFLPAPAQGAIGIEYRQNDDIIRSLLAPLNHEPTYYQIIGERSFLREIDGSCRTPIACNAIINNDEIIIRGEIFSNNMQNYFFDKISGKIEMTEQLGKELAQNLLAKLNAK